MMRKAAKSEAKAVENLGREYDRMRQSGKQKDPSALHLATLKRQDPQDIDFERESTL